MTFDEMLTQVCDLLQREGRVSYRALKRRFNLDDEYLEDVKAELIDAKHLAIDEEGKVLIWTGAPGAIAPVVGEAVTSLARQEEQAAPPSPSAYTPRHLAERIRAEQAALEARGAPDGERKTITALFADIKGSMDLLEGLDPEEARRIVDPALQLMMEAVHRYEGYVAQSLGDGIFALFGAPIAHEDHAHRALYAALRMQEATRQYADTLLRERGVNLEIRVGVNTGEVVVRSIRIDDLHTDYVPIGHSTGLAARLQSLASGGAIVASEATYKLTEGHFAFKAPRVAQVKGVSAPVHLYEVAGVGLLRTRLQVSASRGLVRFVGRQRELEQMQRAFELATGGRGQMVAVVGEPGVGKSRLCYEFKVRAQRGCLVLETFSVSHGKAYPYLPLIELLKHYFQLTPQDDERRRREQVTGKLLTLDRSLEDTLPYVLAVLGDAESTALLAQMDPTLRRRRTFEAITRVLLRESLNQPLLLLIEDLHWLDSETDAWLQVLAERVPTAPILLLVNYRPEYQHTWGSKTYYTQLRLDPLGREEAQELLSEILGDDPGLQALKQIILAKTEGNPFFIEEFVQALVEQGVVAREITAGGRATTARLTRPLTAIQLPPTVQGVLAARIDRLPAEEKALLQTLAVLGKEFPLSLLVQVVGQPEAEVQGALAPLQRGEFIYEQPAFPEPQYIFKHALTQEVAYNSLLLERRRALHERTALALEGLYHDRLEEHYNELAHHYQRSGNAEKAVVYLQRAGQQAAQRSAYGEASAQLIAALELLETLPESRERLQQELLVQTTLGPVLSVAKGYAAPEVERSYTRARELCQLVGDTPQLGPVLWGLHRFYLIRAEHRTAQELAEQLLSLSQHTPASPLFLAAHTGLASALVFQGELIAARGHLLQELSLSDAQERRALAFRYGVDPGVLRHGWAAHDLWTLGYPEAALQQSQATLALAQELAHPYSVAVALAMAALVQQYRRDLPGVHARGEAFLTLATEHGFPYFMAWGAILRGWVLAAQGQAEEGIAQIRQGLAAYRATGAESFRPYMLALLAEAYGRAGQAEEGLAVVAEALAAVHTTGERWWEAELHRLQGELLLIQGTGRDSSRTAPTEPSMMAEAEACFQQALDVARRQEAKSLELRAAMSLSRLWQRQGKRHEARELLAEVYGWFTEGFETADLQEAKTLLAELS